MSAEYLIDQGCDDCDDDMAQLKTPATYDGHQKTPVSRAETGAEARGVTDGLHSKFLNASRVAFDSNARRQSTSSDMDYCTFDTGKRGIQDYDASNY